MSDGSTEPTRCVYLLPSRLSDYIAQELPFGPTTLSRSNGHFHQILGRYGAPPLCQCVSPGSHRQISNENCTQP